MVDTTLVSTLKDGLEIASPVIQGLVSTVMATVFLRGNTKDKEFEMIKAHKFGEAIDALISANKMTYFELYKCKNFLKVSHLADKYMKAEKQESKTSGFNIDWFMRFFDAVGNISNEELQDLWAKVLVGEVSSPNECSLRTLEQIRNLSQEEAKSFNNLCSLVLQSGDSYFIFPTGFYDENQSDEECIRTIANMSLNYGKDVVPLLESGLLTNDHDIAIYLKRGQTLEIHNDRTICIVVNKNDTDMIFQQEAYLLTSSGVELFNIIRKSSHFSFDTKYAHACFNYLVEANKDLAIAYSDL